MMPGLTLLRFPASPIGTPSTTTSGELDPLMELMPRTRTVTPPSGLSFELSITVRPATRPWSNLSIDPDETCVTSEALTEATLPVRSLFFIVP